MPTDQRKKGDSLEDWVGRNRNSYLDYLATMYACTANPLFIWESMRIAWVYDLKPTVCCNLYFGHIAEDIFEATRQRKGFDVALELGTKHKSLLNQFEELKDPHSQKPALWFGQRMLELADEARSRGIKTEKAIIEFIAKRVYRSESLVKKLYLAARKGQNPELVVAEPGVSGTDYEYSLLKEWETG